MLNPLLAMDQSPFVPLGRFRDPGQKEDSGLGEAQAVDAKWHPHRVPFERRFGANAHPSRTVRASRPFSLAGMTAFAFMVQSFVTVKAEVAGCAILP